MPALAVAADEKNLVGGAAASAGVKGVDLLGEGGPGRVAVEAEVGVLLDMFRGMLGGVFGCGLLG